MRINNTFLLLVLLISVATFGQRPAEKLLTFKINSEAAVDGVNVVNLVTKNYTVSNAEGVFKIVAQPGDLLVLTAVHLEYHRIIIETEDLIKDAIAIRMIPRINELAETIVNEHSYINAEALRIIPEGQKKYTPAQRRLKTAGDFKAKDLVGILLGQLSVDPIINAITGRTARLKKELSIETYELLLQKLNRNYDDEYYVTRLNIAPDYVEGFKIFLIENEDFTGKLKSANNVEINFAMAQLAVTFNKLTNAARY